MTIENKALWDRVFITDPRHVKPITGKQYQGNSPKPYWIIEQLTSIFGPCGIGWGFTILSERFERFGPEIDGEALHLATVRLWYCLDDKRGEVEQVGQTRAAYTTSKGKFLVDEDAPKKSVTDAVVKCASYLGFAGDIFSGRWDDSKYVAQALREWEERDEKDASMSDAEIDRWVAHVTDSKDKETWRSRLADVANACGDDQRAADAIKARIAEYVKSKKEKVEE